MPEALSLMKKTRELLKERNEALPTISVATGIPFYWLRKFLYGEIDNPGVNRIQALYEYLADRELQV